MMKGKEESMADHPRKKLQQSQGFWWMFKKLREVGDDLLSLRSHPFCRWMSEFITTMRALKIREFLKSRPIT